MIDRIKEELGLLKSKYPDLIFIEEGQWVFIPKYPLPTGWNRTETDIAFQIPIQYPGGAPYSFHVHSGIQFNKTKPNNYVEPSDVKPPFDGGWGKFSWQPETPPWMPQTEIHAGSNLYIWVLGFHARFKEGL